MDQCANCNSTEFVVLGWLGATMHVRCRCCGTNDTHYMDDIGDDERDE